ncbi:MAG: HD domain-containing protein [Candidatus Nanoarchaeia archaeon]
MKSKLREQLIEIAKEKITKEDPSHDFRHALQVLKNAETIAKTEKKVDFELIWPAALFHDLVVYPKNDPRSKHASDESAEATEQILKEINYPALKIEKVKQIISTCSFSKGIKHEMLEAQIVQDADGLEGTGAIAIMRTFCNTGTMKRPFYHHEDPFCLQRDPDVRAYAVDLFYHRLLKIQERMYTKTGKKLAKKRTEFLHTFLKELKEELA